MTERLKAKATRSEMMYERRIDGGIGEVRGGYRALSVYRSGPRIRSGKSGAGKSDNWRSLETYTETIANAAKCTICSAFMAGLRSEIRELRVGSRITGVESHKPDNEVHQHAKQQDMGMAGSGWASRSSGRADGCHVASRIDDLGRRRPHVRRVPDVEERRLWVESRTSSVCKASGHITGARRQALDAAAQGDP